jgi:hypothetical protein
MSWVCRRRHFGGGGAGIPACDGLQIRASGIAPPRVLVCEPESERPPVAHPCYARRKSRGMNAKSPAPGWTSWPGAGQARWGLIAASHAPVQFLPSNRKPRKQKPNAQAVEPQMNLRMMKLVTQATSAATYNGKPAARNTIATAPPMAHYMLVRPCAPTRVCPQR